MDYDKDSELYGRTTEQERADALSLIAQHRYAQVELTSHDYMSSQRAAQAAGEYGRVAYAYACGWFDSIKRSLSEVNFDLMLNLCWTFGGECEIAEFRFRTGVYGSRYGFARAWELALERNGLALVGPV